MALKKLLLVDDERPARELLKMMVQWEDAGFAPPLEARNGKEALEIFCQEQPDLVITDIQMPVMDGLKLIREIKGINPNKKIAILSCHESFAYAQEALRLGVMEYLLKDALTAEPLLELLRSVKKESCIEDFSKGALAFPQGGTLKSPLPWILKKFPESLFQEGLPPEAEEAIEARCGAGREYFCCMLKPECSRYSLAPWVSRLREEFFKALGISAGGECLLEDVAPIGEGCFLVLVFFRSSHSAMETSNRRYAIIRGVCSAGEALLGERITCGVSDSRGNPKELKKAVREAMEALESRVFLGKGKTLYYDASQEGMVTVQTESLEKRISSVQAALSSKDSQRLEEELGRLYERDLAGIRQYHYLQHVNTLLLGVLTAHCASQGVLCRDVFGEDPLTPQALEAVETVPEMLDWFLARFRLLLGVLTRREQRKYSPRLTRILTFIEAHYCEDIGLDTVADQFHLNKIYLARIFKGETGHSVNEYVRDLRVERAKKLLQDGNNRISAIVGMVGYNSPQSFFSVFKRCVGVSPGEYREGHLVVPRDEI